MDRQEGDKSDLCIRCSHKKAFSFGVEQMSFESEKDESAHDLSMMLQ